MKKETQILKTKGVNSLLAAINHFNSLWEVGRQEAVLISVDHSFEMLLKASIIHRGGKIRQKGQQNTIGFDACIRRGLEPKPMGFLSDEQALGIQTINGLRDAAYHHILQVSEGQLYLHTQSGVTIFVDVLREVFGEELASTLPARALPISTVVPTDPIALFTNEMKEIRALLAPGRRQRTEAESRLRALAIVDTALQGGRTQPTPTELRKLGEVVATGKKLDDVFPGIAAVTFMTEGEGAGLSLRLLRLTGCGPTRISPSGRSASSNGTRSSSIASRGDPLPRARRVPVAGRTDRCGQDPAISGVLSVQGGPPTTVRAEGTGARSGDI